MRVGAWQLRKFGFGQIFLFFGLILLALGNIHPAHAQGAATGGTAVPARPLPPGMKSPVVEYRDIATQAGLTGVDISGSETSTQYIVEATGNGVAIFDFDNDGLPDIFLVNSGTLGTDAVHPKHFLYHNLGGLKFEDVTDKAGIKPTGWGQGVCVGDVDNHGYPDLFITQWGQNVLYRNLGNGTFKDETKERGLLSPKPRWSTGCAFLDFNRDGFLDLVVVHYVDFDLAHTPHPGQTSQCQWKGKPVMCGPRGLRPETLSFYQNDGYGTFIDVSDQVHISGPRNYYGFTALTGDFANDTHTMYKNQGGNNFEDDTIGSGLAVNTKYLGWGTAFLDFDNDGWKDLIVANGHVYPEVDAGHTAEKYKQPRLLYWNRGDGQFFDLSAQGGPGITNVHSSRGLAVGDLDNDGSEEVLISNMGEAPSLLKNFASSGNSLLVRALTSGRDAIGARITVTAGGHNQIDEVRSGGSYMSQNDLRLHFGLGSASSAHISVRWLDGKVENLESAAAGQLLTIEEGKGMVRTQPYTSAKK